MSYENDIKEALAAYKAGALSDEEVIARFHQLNMTDLGFAKLDHDRSLRRGFPEVVYCEGKTISQAAAILTVLASRHKNVLGTRASEELYETVKPNLPDAVYYERARLIVLEKEPLPKDPDRKIAVITAGTSDVPVAEEAAVTAEIMGNEVIRIYDVGVAGITHLRCGRCGDPPAAGQGGRNPQCECDHRHCRYGRRAGQRSWRAGG